MLIDFDPEKNATNLRERGLSFDQVADFDFDTALVTEDMRKTKRKSLIDAAGEVRELTAADLRSFKAANTVLPAELQATLGMRSRGPQKAPTKVSTTIRLSSEVVQAFRATGDGWQTRVDAALKDWLKTHSPV